MDLDFLKVALEERSDGAAVIEDEIVYYARVDIKKLPTTPLREHQEQWTIKIGHTDDNAGRGDIRVRKTDYYDAGDLGRSEFVLTTKVRLDGQKAHEVPIPSTEDQFTHFKTLAESGMIKDRLTYKIDGTDMAWEVDLFVNPKGGFYPWVKIDLEKSEQFNGQVPDLPFETIEIIKGQNGKRLPAEEAKVRELYDTMFLTKNPGAKNQHAPEMDDTDEQDDANPIAATAATEDHKEWEAAWPEFYGTPVDPTVVPNPEIYQSKDQSVQSEPDENRPVEGTAEALEVIQEFNNEVEALAQKMQIRLMHLSLGQGYVTPDSLYKQLAGKSPDTIPISQSGDFGDQYYYVKNPAPGAVVGGVGWHFNYPTLSTNQMQF
jgi:hypothetical protein